MRKKVISSLAWFTGVSLILIGLLHFLFPFKFASIVPDFLPYPVILGLLAGWIEIFLGAGILYKPTRQLCALGYLVLLIAVFPANIYLALENGLPLNVSAQGAWIRLPFQAVFIAFAWILKSEDKYLI